MKSCTRVRVIVATVCLLPFQACTNADVEFTNISGAGEPARAGTAGKESPAAGFANAGFGAKAGDAGINGVAGEAGEPGASGAAGESSGAAGTTGGSQGGNGGYSGGVAHGGRAGAGGMNAGAGGTNAGTGGTNAGTGGTNAGTGGTNAGTGGTNAGAGGTNAGAGGKSAGAGGTNAGAGGTSGGQTNGGAGSGGAAAAGTAGTSSACGNGVREAGEQCDDGNTASLDACSAACAFEQSHRANFVEQKFATSTLCPKNAFGGAIAGSAQAALQATLSQRVTDGSLSLLFAFRGLSDLSGNGTQSFTLSVGFGAPRVMTNYNGSSDLDWWYTPASGQMGSNGELYASAAASLVGGVLNANTGSILLPLLSEVPLTLSSSKVRLSLGAASVPLSTTNGSAPGHLASEHLQPNLVSFASAGPPPAMTVDPGQLCGDINASSLAGLAIPATYAASGTSPCMEGYGSARTFLDLLVGGCSVAGEPIVRATQPDEIDPGAPQAGAGGPYRLTTNAITHAVTGCRDKANTAVTLSTCLRAAAYSSAYRLKTGRVIIK